MNHLYRKFELNRFIYLLEDNKEFGASMAPVEKVAENLDYPDRLKNKGEAMIDASDPVNKRGMKVLRRNEEGKLKWVERTREQRIQDRADRRSSRELARKAESIQVSKDTEFFQSPTGRVIAYSFTSSEDGLYTSDDGNIFYEMYERGSGGTNFENEVTFENPQDGRQSRFERKDSTLLLNGEVFTKISSPKKFDVIRMPEVPEVDFVYILPNGERLTATRDKYDSAYEKRRINIGNREVEILKWEIMQDGGTKYIDTSEGKLFIPSPFRKDKKPTWNGKEITESF